MRRVCAWCRQPMGEPAESGEVTRRRCRECYRSQQPKVTARFAVHPQSGGTNVVQVWRENDLGDGAWAWVRTPTDFVSLTEEETAAIKSLVS